MVLKIEMHLPHREHATSDSCRMHGFLRMGTPRPVWRIAPRNTLFIAGSETLRCRKFGVGFYTASRPDKAAAASTPESTSAVRSSSRKTD